MEGEKTWAPPLAQSCSRWARVKSWGVCKVCKRLEKRSFLPGDVVADEPEEPTSKRVCGRNAGKRSARMEKCTYCRDRAGYPSPSIHDIPEPLRKLSTQALEAFRPVEIFTGPYMRANFGYRVRTDMILFRWKATDVRTAILRLPRRHRRRVMDAWN